MSQFSLLLLLALLCLLFTSCGLLWLGTATAFDAKNAPPPPDYADLRDWAAHPARQDYSDTMPQILSKKTLFVLVLYIKKPYRNNAK